MKLRLPTARISRDTVLLAVGISGIVYETVSGRGNTTLVIAFIGMIGSPVVIRTDETRRSAAATQAAGDAAAETAAADKAADDRAAARALLRAAKPPPAAEPPDTP